MHQMIGKTYKLLGREPLDIETPDISNLTVLVTGSSGFIGKALSEETRGFPCDIGTNVLNRPALQKKFDTVAPDVVFHLAAHKYATEAEEIPAEVAELNIIGTNNVVEEAVKYSAKVVLASTCKAADPCTAYGASKLIAEKVVLNYWNGVVFRLVNVIGSTGSVVDIWDNLPSNVPLPTIDGIRYWISPEEAVKFLLASSVLEVGLYAPNPKRIPGCSARTIANRYDRSREKLVLPLRRGDRFREKLLAEYESIEGYFNNMIKIREPWTREGDNQYYQSQVQADVNDKSRDPNQL